MSSIPLWRTLVRLMAWSPSMCIGLIVLASIISGYSSEKYSIIELISPMIVCVTLLAGSACAFYLGSESFWRDQHDSLSHAKHTESEENESSRAEGI